MYTDVNTLTEDMLNAWLKAQPDERPVAYFAIQGCPGYSFLKDMGVDIKEYGVDHYKVQEAEGNVHPAPEFLARFVRDVVVSVHNDHRIKSGWPSSDATYAELKARMGLEK